MRTTIRTTTVTVDAETGRMLHAHDAVRAPLSNRIGEAMFPIHNG